MQIVDSGPENNINCAAILNCAAIQNSMHAG